MSQELWTDVDKYINSHIVSQDSALTGALGAAEAAGLPAINVAPNQGKLLHLMAKMARAAKILEIGTLGGYSTIWLARALPASGKLISLEYDSKHADVAKSSIAAAGLGEIVEIRIGAALDLLPKVESDGIGPFDFIFIDADKVNNPHYLDWALRLSHIGTVIICDNVVRNGSIVSENDAADDVVGTRRFFEALSKNERLSATALQTVGSKGYDGFALAVVVA